MYFILAMLSAFIVFSIHKLFFDKDYKEVKRLKHVIKLLENVLEHKDEEIKNIKKFQ